MELYAAAWWMSRERFLGNSGLDPSLGLSLEAAFFAPLALAGKGLSDVRRSVDWLDFSVEHLSKWTTMVRSRMGGLKISLQCQAYVHRQLEELQTFQETHTGPPPPLLMNRTLVVLPFFSGETATTVSHSNELVSYLMATIVSLLPHAPKRIVVVGHSAHDAALVAEAVGHLLYDQATTSQKGKESPEGFLASSFRKGAAVDLLLPSAYPSFPTEIAYVQPPSIPPPQQDAHLDEEMKERPAPPTVHVPRTALLQLEHELSSPGVEAEAGLLGRHAPKDFDHIYYSEPDQILLARLVDHQPAVAAADAWWKELSQGKVLVPHRLQSLPHPHDIPTSETQLDRLLPLDQPLHHLSAWGTASCCDHGKILLPEEKEKQEEPWWIRGFVENGNFSKALQSLSLMTLENTDPGGDGFPNIVPGTGMVLIGGSVQGGKCLPSPLGRYTCQLPP